MKEKILGINGLGRIGKLTLWHHVGRKYFDRIVVNQGRAVGKDLSALAQAIEKDSTYGPLHRFLYGYRGQRAIEIQDERQGRLRIDGIPVTVLREQRNPKDIPWRDHGVELVADCTGSFNDPTLPPDHPKGSIRGHLQGGARKVVGSAPFKVKDKSRKMPEDAATFIYGINHRQFDPRKHLIASAASCTTTALAHMILPLVEHFQSKAIMTASMSTVHAVTNTQSVLDSVPKAGDSDLRKKRSILNNIILTSTGAAAALEAVIPEVREIGFMADSVRVPIPTESLIILNVTFQSRLQPDGRGSISAQVINDLYQEAADGKQEGLLRFTLEQNVSSDLVGDPAAVIIEGCETHTRTGFITVDLREVPGLPADALALLPETLLKVPVTHAKIFGWYDNEYGSYTNRLADLCVYMHGFL
ncbi:MAG: glyceraldehyde 3-phosphate dehydrogenase NAD-binding domain-containing protein [bacterium]